MRVNDGRNKPVIDRIVQGEDIPNEEYNVFTESFRNITEVRR